MVKYLTTERSVIIKIFNTYIDVKSFIQRGTPTIKDDFFVGLITGYQGTGKSYLGIYLLNKFRKGTHIYTNIKSFKNNRYNISYFKKIDDICDNFDTDEVYLIDEISNKYMGKDCKKDQRFYRWLQQSRKRRRTVFLITQEYLQVPQWLRGVANTIFTTSKIKCLPLFITYRGQAVLDDETKEWSVIPEKRYIYKRTKSISNQYDTLEPIESL